jgi:hypothetical protein
MSSELELLLEYLEYRDGNLYWKKKTGARSGVGSRVGYLRKDGYLGMMFNRKSYLVHRIIFGIVYGYFPEVVDHINHNRSDNRIENLREADYNKNIHNSRKSKSNSTGIKGVRRTYNGRYECRVAFQGVTHQVGTFSTLEEAEKQVREYRQKLHKEFTCHG